MISPLPAPGTAAPSFKLADQDAVERSLDEFKESYVILYFYPKDNTSGCTLEAVEFTQHAPEFKELGGIIIGISPDSVKSHKSSCTKKNLAITLLSDVDKKVLETYGVWQTKKMYGKEHLGVVRSTFLLDPDGVVRRVWSPVKVNGHVAEVLAALKALKS